MCRGMPMNSSDQRYYVCGCWRITHHNGTHSLCRLPDENPCELHDDYHRRFRLFHEVLIGTVVWLIVGSLLAVVVRSWFLAVVVWVLAWLFLLYGPPKVPENIPPEMDKTDWLLERVQRKRTF